MIHNNLLNIMYHFFGQKHHYFKYFHFHYFKGRYCSSVESKSINKFNEVDEVGESSQNNTNFKWTASLLHTVGTTANLTTMRTDWACMLMYYFSPDYH